jgi:hypothetical protein
MSFKGIVEQKKTRLNGDFIYVKGSRSMAYSMYREKENDGLFSTRSYYFSF